MNSYATRAAAQIYETLERLRLQPGGDLLSDRCTAALLKAMLVHGAAWGEGRALLTEVVREGAASNKTSDQQKTKDRLARFFGYGRVDPVRVVTCGDHRVTLVGCGVFVDAAGFVFRFPLPPSLHAVAGLRRLTVTLAWLTPIKPSDRRYRRAKLWFDVVSGDLSLDRQDVDGRAVGRGTVQHEIFVGKKAVALQDGATLTIRVSCNEDAGPLNGERVPFGLVATLEVAEELDLQIYEEVAERVRPRVRV